MSSPELPLGRRSRPATCAPDQLDVSPFRSCSLSGPQPPLPPLGSGRSLGKEGGGRGARYRPKVFRATKSREPHAHYRASTDNPQSQPGGCPCSPGRGTEAPGASESAQGSCRSGRTISVQLSDKGLRAAVPCRPRQPHCLQSDGCPTPAVCGEGAPLGASLLLA